MRDQTDVRYRSALRSCGLALRSTSLIVQAVGPKSEKFVVKRGFRGAKRSWPTEDEMSGVKKPALSGSFG